MATKRLGPTGQRKDEAAKLYKLCRRFVESRNISCGETIWQTDRVTEDVEQFIESICKTIGYAIPEDD